MYPLPLLSSKISIAPICGTLRGLPYIFNFSIKNPSIDQYRTTTFEHWQKTVFEELAVSGRSWGIGCYLENRATLLRQYPQMIQEGRIYHVGIDIIVPGGTEIFAPIAGRVFAIGREEGLGNYGGFLVLEHTVDGDNFFTFYGHLQTPHFLRVGDIVSLGQKIACLGSKPEDTGWWFTHLHFQILTKNAVDAGRVMQGYATKEDLCNIESIFPNPMFLFRSS